MRRTTTAVLMATMILATASASFGEPKVARRQERQQQRIGNGVSNGSLTPKETGHLESREANLHHEVQADRAANGGTLSPAERARVNRQQNRISGAIYRDKHNAFKQQQ